MINSQKIYFLIEATMTTSDLWRSGLGCAGAPIRLLCGRNAMCESKNLAFRSTNLKF